MAVDRIPKLHAVIGQRLREIRVEQGASQEEVARWVRDQGLPWNGSQLAKVERGERSVTLEEFILLAAALEVPLHELLPETGWVRLSQGVALRADTLGGLFDGANPEDQEPGGWRMISPGIPEDEELTLAGIIDGRPLAEARKDLQAARAEMRAEAEQKAARSLGISTLELVLLARRRWGRSLTDERERRLDEAEREVAGDDPELRQRVHATVRRTYRGHVTRVLVHELRRELVRLANQGSIEPGSLANALDSPSTPRPLIDRSEYAADSS